MEGKSRKLFTLSCFSIFIVEALVSLSVASIKLENLWKRYSEKKTINKVFKDKPLFTQQYRLPQNHLISCIAITSDGMKLASLGNDSILVFWDLKTGKELYRLKDHRFFVCSFAFSLNNKYLATGGFIKRLTLINVNTGKIEREFGHPGSGAYCVAFSPDEKYIAAAVEIIEKSGPKWSINVWEIKSGDLVKTVCTQNHFITTIDFCPKGNLIAVGSQESKVSLWNFFSGERYAEFAVKKGGVLSVKFSPDGKLLAAGGNDIFVWEVASRKPFKLPRKFPTEGNYSVDFFTTDRIVSSGSSDGTIRVIDLNSGTTLQKFVGDKFNKAISLSKDGKVLASIGYDKTIRIWKATVQE